MVCLPSLLMYPSRKLNKFTKPWSRINLPPNCEPRIHLQSAELHPEQLIQQQQQKVSSPRAWAFRENRTESIGMNPNKSRNTTYDLTPQNEGEEPLSDLGNATLQHEAFSFRGSFHATDTDTLIIRRRRLAWSRLGLRCSSNRNPFHRFLLPCIITLTIIQARLVQLRIISLASD